MATNNFTKDDVLALFPDNANYEITAADMRQYVEAIFNDKEVVIVKIPTLSDLAFNNFSIYEGSLVVIYLDSDPSLIGIYMSKINQPVIISDLIQLSTITGGTGGTGGSSERGGLLYNENKSYLIGDIVSVITSAYICITPSAIPASAFNPSDWILISSGSIQIIDNLNSTSQIDALSANMGRELNVTKEPNLPDGTGNGGFILTLGNDETTRVWQPTTNNAIQWFPTIMYSLNNIISYEGFMYKALQTSINQQPDIQPLFWRNILIDEAPTDGKTYWRSNNGWTDNTDYGSY